MSFFKYIKSLFVGSPKVLPLHGLSGVKKAEALFHNLVVQQKVPGLSITILKDGQTILQQGYGFADLENRIAVDAEKTIFRIASISKCITGLALGKMVEDGLLHWDDSFYKHIPNYPKKKHEFTICQLASHTAGIRGYRGKEYTLNKPYSIKDSLEVFMNDPLEFKPGQGYLYNSFDFVLLSLAMQEASGIHFEDYVKENVLEPLDMGNTFHPKRGQSVFDTQFYTKTANGFKKALEVNNFYKLAGGGYLSTSKDIAKLGQAIIEKKLLKEGTFKQLLTSQIVDGQSTYYGLGFQVSKDADGRSFVGHVGNSIGAYTNFFVYPEEKTVISILINCTDPKVQPVLDEAINAIFDERFV